MQVNTMQRRLNKSSGNKGTKHDSARLIVWAIFLRKELTLTSVELE